MPARIGTNRSGTCEAELAIVRARTDSLRRWVFTIEHCGPAMNVHSVRWCQVTLCRDSTYDLHQLALNVRCHFDRLIQINGSEERQWINSCKNFVTACGSCGSLQRLR